MGASIVSSFVVCASAVPGPVAGTALVGATLTRGAAEGRQEPAALENPDAPRKRLTLRAEVVRPPDRWR
jgi:hypothetical protein